MSTWSLFISEFLGTATLLTLGAGVVANNLLKKSKGRGTGFLMVNFGWGLAVFAGVYIAYRSGGHLNPAVTLGLAFQHMLNPEVTLAADVPVTAGNVLVYLAAQFLGAFAGAVFAWLAYKKQFDEPADPGIKLGVFATGPEIRSTPWNLMTEIIATSVLVGFVLVAGGTPSGLGPLAVAFIVVGIGASLGGPTGYAINPARDLGPRVAHAVLPIPNKGSSDWSYAWIPVVGPIIGAILAVLVVQGLGLADFSVVGA